MNKIIEGIAAIIFINILLFVFLQIIFRYVLSISVPWTEESSRFLFIGLIFLGSIGNMMADNDIKLTLLSSRLPPKANAWLCVVIYIIVGCFAVIFLLGSFSMAKMNWELPSLTIPWFNVGYLYAITVFSSGSVIVIALAKIFASIRELLYRSVEAETRR